MTILFRRAILVIGLLSVLGMAWLAVPAAGRSFVFARVEIDATVGPDGSPRIVEERTYRFDGSFSWASYRLPLTGASRIREVRMWSSTSGTGRLGSPLGAFSGFTTTLAVATSSASSGSGRGGGFSGGGGGGGGGGSGGSAG
jgi:hypothetical protein